MNTKLINWYLSGGGGGGGSYSDEYNAILTRATALGYTHPSDACKALQNQLVLDLIAAGFWAKCDVIRVYAHDGGSKFGLINWVNPNTHLGTMPAGDLTFTSNLGFTAGNGTLYIDDNYNPSTEGVKFVADNASISYYKSSSQTINTINGNIHSVSGLTKLQANRGAGINLAYYFVNNVGFSASASISYNGNGLLSCSLNMAASPDIAALRDGSVIASTDVGARTIADGMRNCFYGNDISSFVAYGADIRSVHGTLSTLISTYLAAL